MSGPVRVDYPTRADKPGRTHECRSKRLREVSHGGRRRARRWREGDSRVSDARTRRTGARAGPACSGEGHQDPRLLPAQLQPERPTGLPPKQHGRPRRHRRRHYGHRSRRVAGHGPQCRQKRHRQERVRHRDDLAGGLHGRVLLSRQGAAARARCHRPGAVGYQGQGAERAALSAVRGQGARAHRALCDVGSAPGPGSAGRSGGDGLEGSRGGDDGGGLSRVPRGRRHSAEHWPRARRCGWGCAGRSRGRAGCRAWWRWTRRGWRPGRLDVRFEIAHPADHPGGGANPRGRRPRRQLDDRPAPEVRLPRGRGSLPAHGAVTGRSASRTRFARSSSGRRFRSCGC